MNAGDTIAARMAKLSLGVNPLTVKELRGRMRGARAYAVVTVYISIVSGIALLLYTGVSLSNPNSGVGNSSQVGAALFYVVVGLQIVLVSFVAPAFTTGAISGERERQTFDLLKATLLTPRQIVWGKLTPALGFILLLVMATIPLFSLAFLLGGVEPLQFGAALCVILASAALFTTLGLYVSSRTQTTLSATIITYALVVGIVIGLSVLAIVAFPLLSTALGRPGSGAAGAATPVLTVLFFALVSISPIGALVTTEANFQSNGNMFVLSLGPFPPATAPVTMPAPFLILMVCYLVASVVLFWLTTRAVRR